MSFAQFIKERKYLHNVTPATIRWHQFSLATLGVEQPTEADLKAFVLRMRESGLSPISCNTKIRSVNAYLRWLGSGLHVGKLKVEANVPATYSASQIEAIVRWKPKNFYQRRLHVLLLMFFDTGCRHDELLSVHVPDVDLDNCLLTVTGKGRRQRIIPYSVELRRHLAKFLMDYRKPYDLVFATKEGRKLSQRNVLRDVKALCSRLGFQAPRRSVHGVRHTMATEYVRRGGSPFLLMRTLGHTTLQMTNRYVSLVTADLSHTHAKVSLLR